jgi:DNA-binding MarR family transcriptional regulator
VWPRLRETVLAGCPFAVACERRRLLDDQDTLLPDIEYELLLLSRNYARYAKPGKTLESSGYLLLSRLELGPPLSIKEIATALGLDLSTVHRQVAALQGRHLVKAVFVANSGAIRRIAPTAKGLGALKDHREQNSRALEAILDNWEEPDLARLHDLLLRLNRGIEEREGRVWPRPGSS